MPRAAPMPLIRLLPTIALLLALAACRSEPAPDAAQSAPSEPGQVVSPTRGDVFELTWLGILPCADCDGIQTRLTLASDGDGRSYQLEETYLGGDGENRFEQTGAWVEQDTEIDGEPAVVYRLDPEGAGRWFWLQPDGGLEMLDGANQPSPTGLAYRLQRL